ncbi:MAG: hypothetical protein KJ630_05815 [Proteobacteria bacterium]|nr:hypothetical protein [Pseudomonadota bacterium]
MPDFLSYIAYTLTFEEADNESSSSGDISRTITLRDSTAILIKIPVKDVVAAVFSVKIIAKAAGKR